jgi:hypothetical protein
MSVTKIRKVPSNLPYAHLYLDDIEEICKILFDASHRPDKIDNVPDITFLIGDDLKIDTIEELREHGGSATKFSIEFEMAAIRLEGFSGPSAFFYGIQDAEKWAVYGRIRAVFDARRLVLKNAIMAIPDFLRGALVALFILSMGPVVIYLRLHLVALRIYVVAAYVIAFCLVGGVLALSTSRVSFVRSHERSKAAIENRKGLVKTIFLMVLAAVLGAVITHFASQWK